MADEVAIVIKVIRPRVPAGRVDGRVPVNLACLGHAHLHPLRKLRENPRR
jgi:hypothetical protein